MNCLFLKYGAIIKFIMTGSPYGTNWTMESTVSAIWAPTRLLINAQGKVENKAGANARDCTF